MPRAHRDGPLPRVILCAVLTVDGKLIDDPPVVPPELYDGDADPARHPWAGLYDGAAAILVDDQLRSALPLPQAARRPIITVSQHGFGEMENWQPELRAAMRQLRPAGRGRSVLCFGGAALFRALLDGGWVSELWLAIRPRVDGRRDAATLSGPPGAAFFPASVACRLLGMETCGGDCFLRYRVVRERGRKSLLHPGAA